MRVKALNFKLIVEWYNENKRDLPFRKNRDPYRIWISEIMAQQTQITTMLSYYERWMSKWPTLNDLYHANEEEVLKAWEGLGYYTRCRKIMECAKVIVEQYDGIFPREYEVIEKLPGIGPYTAGAISSIAFNSPNPAVDGNAIRVFSRLFCLDTSSSTDEVYNIILNGLKENEPCVLNQGIMELGALVCLKNPKCDICPLKDECLSYKNNCQLDYPIKPKAKAKKEYEMYTYWLEDKDGNIMITKMVKDNLMKGYYRLPQYEKNLNIGTFKEKKKHVFSHLIWNMNIYEEKVETCLDECEFVTKDKLQELAFIGAHRKIIKEKLK